METNTVEQYDAEYAALPSAERTRREAELLTAYASHLRSLRHTVNRHSITVDGQLLLTDLFDETAGELVEAKSSVDRNVMRLALGQILDYARYVDAGTLTVLVPRRPTNNLLELLHDHGVGVVWQDGHGFDRSPAPES